MGLPEHKTMDQLKKEILGKNNSILRALYPETYKSIEKLMIEAYNQGTLCQHSSPGNRVGHFEEFVGTKTKES